MARPQKAGLDYYPLDTDIDNDDKIALIEAKYGIEGFGVIIKLFNKIYSTNGYYCNWNEDIQLLFSKKIGVDFNKVGEILNDALKWGIFDNKIFQKYKVLTSKRIQKTYLKIVYKRKEVEIIKEFIVDGINDIRNYDNVVINSINDSNNPQSKVKESKVKESKEKYAEYVSLTQKEYQTLVEKYGEKNTKAFIQKLNAYKGSTGKKYKSDYLAILNWVIESVLKTKTPPSTEIDYKKFVKEAKLCFLNDHKGYCENPSYTSAGKIMKICEICKDNRARWRGG